MAKRTCSIPDCGLPYKSSGYCNRHWLRWKRHGDPLAGRTFQEPKSPEPCSLPGCDKPHYAKGYCSKHYQMWRANGDPTINRAPKGVPAAERFWPKVNKVGPIPAYRPDLGPCWLWTGAKSTSGYGVFDHWGAAHVAWELLVGPFPPGLEPDHLCRVRACVKAVADEHGPAHLEPVTRRVNILRSDSISAVNARKTHCDNGHPFDAANTYITKEGFRQCRACRREWYRRRRPDPS